jgi:hypothetical protein
MIQLVYFPSSPGTQFQGRMKDKWRTLCEGVRKKQSTRSSVPEHLWRKIETLRKLHGTS